MDGRRLFLFRTHFIMLELITSAVLVSVTMYSAGEDVSENLTYTTAKKYKASECMPIANYSCKAAAIRCSSEKALALVFGLYVSQSFFLFFAAVISWAGFKTEVAIYYPILMIYRSIAILVSF